MNVNALKDGECAVIKHIEVNDLLLDRLFSFGIAKAKQIKKVKSSLGGSTILLELDRSRVMLRAEEAESIEVERVNA